MTNSFGFWDFYLIIGAFIGFTAHAVLRIKRKPKKVLLHNPRKSCFEYGCVCDRCKHEVIQITDDYCPICGQAIDWSDEG